jgi:hypothetical protein
MRCPWPCIAIFGICSLLSGGARAQQLQHRPPEQNPRVVICRVMEAHTSRDPAVTVVLFHQRDKADAKRLSGLLRRASAGGAVEFQMGEGGAWQTATVARLKSCFGRGLLIVREGTAPLSEGATFLLRFPVATLTPAAGMDSGDSVGVALRKDRESREIPVPDDLARRAVKRNTRRD